MNSEAVINHNNTAEVPSVFKNKKFILLILTFLASSFSVSFFMFTVNWYVVDHLRLETMLGVVFFASSMPRLVFMLMGGVMADRFNRAWIMFVSDFTKGILLLGVVVLLVFNMLSIWPLVVLGLIFGLLDAFFWPASSSILPTILSKEQLTRGNAVIDTVRNVSIVSGPLLAGIIIGLGSYEMIFGIVSLMMLLSAFIDWLLKIKLHNSKETSQHESSSKALESIKEGFSYLKTSPFLSTLMIASVFLNLCFAGPVQVGLPIFARNVLGGDEITFSWLSASLSIGMLLGTLVVGYLNIKKKRGMVAVSAIGGIAVLFTAFSLVNTFWINIVLIILVGAATSFTNIPLNSAIQHYTEEKFIGRVMSLVQFSTMGLIPVSFLLTSLMISLGMSIQHIMLLGGASMCLLSAIILLKAQSLRKLN